MKKYIGKRIVQLIPVLLGITFLSFAMMRAAGSDAIIELYGDKGAVAQEIIDAKRAELGLDQPFLTQYGTHIQNPQLPSGRKVPFNLPKPPISHLVIQLIFPHRSKIMRAFCPVVFHTLFDFQMLHPSSAVCPQYSKFRLLPEAPRGDNTIS